MTRDLAHPETKADVNSIFGLGTSGGSNIAVDKDSMIADAFESAQRNLAATANPVLSPFCAHLAGKLART